MAGNNYYKNAQIVPQFQQSKIVQCSQNPTLSGCKAKPPVPVPTVSADGVYAARDSVLTDLEKEIQQVNDKSGRVIAALRSHELGVPNCENSISGITLAGQSPPPVQSNLSSATYSELQSGLSRQKEFYYDLIKGLRGEAGCRPLLVKFDEALPLDDESAARAAGVPSAFDCVRHIATKGCEIYIGAK